MRFSALSIHKWAVLKRETPTVTANIARNPLKVWTHFPKGKQTSKPLCSREFFQPGKGKLDK